MRLVGVTVAVVALALAAVSVVHAGPASGTTTLLGPAQADSPVDVDVSITTNSPIVAYEYSVVNQCWLSGKTRGHYDSYERFDLTGPWFDIGGTPHTTVTVNLQLVTEGAACKVFIVKNNAVVKGSTTSYIVGP